MDLLLASQKHNQVCHDGQSTRVNTTGHYIRYSTSGHCGGWSHWQAISASSLPASRHASPQYSCPSGTSQRHGICAHSFIFGFAMIHLLQAESLSSAFEFGLVVKTRTVTKQLRATSCNTRKPIPRGSPPQMRRAFPGRTSPTLTIHALQQQQADRATGLREASGRRCAQPR